MGITYVDAVVQLLLPSLRPRHDINMRQYWIQHFNLGIE